MIKKNRINWMIIFQILLIIAYCTPIFAKHLRGLVYFVPLLAVSLLLFAFTKSSVPVFTLLKKSLRQNRLLFLMLIWYIAGLAFSFLRYAENTNFLLSAFLLPVFFFYGSFINSKPQYHYITVMCLVFCLFLNTFFTGSEIGFNLSARDIQVKANSFIGTIGAAGYWGIIAIFFPIFLTKIKNIEKRYFRIVYISILTYLLYKLFFSGFATALVLIILNFITTATLLVYYNAKNLKHFLMSLIFLILTLVGIYYLINWILISEDLGLNAIKWRLQNIINDPKSGGYTSNYTSRYDLFFVSLETFKRFPIFGSGADVMTMSNLFPNLRCGGHSSFIDVLAILGIFGGGGAFVLFFIKSLSNAYSFMKKRRSFEYICHTSVVFTLVIGGILNPYWMGSILIVFLLLTHIYKTSPSDF